MNKTIWKLGCNWGKGKTSFYKLISEKQIVIGVHDKRYSIGDLILITEGFTAYAIVKITSSYTSVTEKPEFETDFKNYEIDYEEWVEIYQGEWYELDEKDVFEYQLQQGIAKIQQEEIKLKILNLMNKFEFNKMIKTNYFASGPVSHSQPDQAIKQATDKRDLFIKKNISAIGKIMIEDILITSTGGQFIIAVIKLTYYPK